MTRQPFWSPQPPTWLANYVALFVCGMVVPANHFAGLANLMFAATYAATTLVMIYPLTHLVFWLWRTFKRKEAR